MNTTIVPENLIRGSRERTKGKRFQVVALPDYVVKTLSSLGVSLGNLDDMLRLYVNNDNTLPNGNRAAWVTEHKLIDWFAEKLSKNDISDILVANGIVGDLLASKNMYNANICSFTANDLWELKTRGYAYDDNYRNFVSFYADEKINISDIVLDDENNVCSIVKTVVTETTVFVILQRGFTNFIAYPDLTFKEKFFSRILNLVFRSYGEEATMLCSLYHNYINMLMLKK